jgi:hypothetical protein
MLRRICLRGISGRCSCRSNKAAYKERLPAKLPAPQDEMKHPIYRVTAFDVVADYTLRVRFDDETEQTIDFRPILAGELYGPLCDISLAEWSGLRSGNPARLADSRSGVQRTHATLTSVVHFFSLALPSISEQEAGDLS